MPLMPSPEFGYTDIVKRTVISLRDADKQWLDEAAAKEGIATTELVRRAIQLLRERSLELPPFGEVLRRTRGLWRVGDGLEHQTRLRDEW
jgi:hypothetical protein